MQPWGDAELCWKHVYLHPLSCQHAGCRTRLDCAYGFAGERSVVVGLVTISAVDEAGALLAAQHAAVMLLCSTDHTYVCKVTAQQ